MNGRNSEADQSHYKYDKNRTNYLPIDNFANYHNSQGIFKKLPANCSRRNLYSNPKAALNNYQTYFVPVTDYNSTTAKGNQQSLHTQYSYSSNSLYPTYVQDQNKVNDDGNKVIYLKYPNNDLQFKDSKYYSQSNYLLKEQENFYEYDIVPSSQNYSYYISDDKTIYKNPGAQLQKMVYSSYVPDVDVKYANNANFYYACSSDPSVNSQRSIDDIIDYPVNKNSFNEIPEKISANKIHDKRFSKKNPDIINRISKSNIPDKMKKSNTCRMNNIYGNPCDETPTKQHSTINANTQTSNHALTKENSSNKICTTTILNNEFTQTEHKDMGISRSQETQTLNGYGVTYFFNGFLNNLAKKGISIYSFYLRTSVIRWLRRILIELAWSVYNCPSNCPMQDRIIFSYLNHIERKSSLESNECQNYLSPPSRRCCRKQRPKN